VLFKRHSVGMGSLFHRLALSRKLVTVMILIVRGHIDGWT
jgi:hypothetical protein